MAAACAFMSWFFNLNSSFRRRPESRCIVFWTPAFAGVTACDILAALGNHVQPIDT